MPTIDARLLYVLAAVLALTAGIAVKTLPTRHAQPEITALPPYVLPDLSGRPHDLDEWRDKVRIVNFWATWCPPCRKEIPGLIALQQRHAAQGLVVIGIAIDEPAAVADYVGSAGITYPVLLAQSDGEALAHKLGNVVNAVPFTVIADRQGRIVHRQPGEMSQDALATIIAPLLEQQTETR